MFTKSSYCSPKRGNGSFQPCYDRGVGTFPTLSLFPADSNMPRENIKDCMKWGAHMLLPQKYKPTSYELVQDQYAYDLWCEEGSDNLFHNHLLNALRVALVEELTEQQYAYIVAYYYDQNTLEEIAKRFSVNKSTVSRAISAAKKRLKHVLRYASPRLLKASQQEGYAGARKRSPRRRN